MFLCRWSYLQVETNPQNSDVLQAFGAGYVESLLTYDVIYMHWYNTMHGFCTTKLTLCQKVQNHLDKNLDWINDMIANYSDTQPYWHQVRLYLVINMGFHINNVDLRMSSFVWTAPVIYVWLSNIRKTWFLILWYIQYYTVCTQRIRTIRVVVEVVMMVGGSSSGDGTEKKKTNI